MGLRGQAKYHRKVVLYTMDMGFIIPWVWEVKQNTIDRWFNVPWVRGSIYHGFEWSNKIP